MLVDVSRWALWISVSVALGACSKKDVKPSPEGIASRAPSASSTPSEPPPGGCKGEEKPVELGSTTGNVHGFAQDATHVYFTSWQSLATRGDLGRVRKDGGGGNTIKSLSLEPRGLVVDDTRAFFTSGIRLMVVPKAGGDDKVLAETFSSQSIAGDASYVYGVPGDYGPYDRLIRAAKADGTTKELDVSERPEVKTEPTGFSAIAVDDAGIYVTDSGANRVLRFQLDRAKPKVLAGRQDKAFGLAIDEANVYFTLGLKGDLMKVAKSGGTPSKLASGLAQRARIAADAGGIYAPLGGPGENAPKTVARLPTVGGTPTELATVPASHSVEAIAVDEKCVYWAERDPDSQKVIVFARAR